MHIKVLRKIHTEEDNGLIDIERVAHIAIHEAGRVHKSDNIERFGPRITDFRHHALDVA